MQCNWQPLARLAFRGFARPSPACPSRTIHTHLKVKASPTPWAAAFVTPHSPIKHRLPVHYRLHSTVLAAETPPSIAEKLISPKPEVLKNHTEASPRESAPAELTLTPAQIGRTAAHAVRLSARQGNLADAFLIVRSLYHARLSDRGQAAAQPVPLFPGEAEDTLIPFDKTVSPRLPAHTLLHSLVRLGEHQHAARLAQQMLESGTAVRTPTLEAILRGLHALCAAAPPQVLVPLLSLKALDATLVQPHMRGNAHLTGAALQLVQAARHAGQRSTRRMYRCLMALCIINGEIILASLLFGVLLREWQARQQAALAGVPPPAPAVAAAPQPRLVDMKEILEFVNWNLAAPQTDESSRVAFSASLQALANLAHAMDAKYLSLNLEPLIAAIYKCPRTKEEVWARKKPNGPPRLVDGYQYPHSVLDRLIRSLPEDGYENDARKNTKHKKNKSRSHYKENEKEIEPLNPWAYNTLLNYTLRHRHSIDLAKIVLTRLLRHPEANLPKNADLMHNILARARNDFPPTVVDKLMTSAGLIPSGADSLSELVNVADSVIDQYALSTRIATLTRNGQVSEIVDALPSMLPGLYPPPNSEEIPFAQARMIRAKHREDGLSRAVALGPVVFSSLLHALRKDGKIGLTENVFLYGLEAEAKSFEPQTPVVRPWCLPVHAYTAMIQAYYNERRKGEARNRFVVGWGLTASGRRLRPLADRPRLRTDLAHKMIVLMYKTMMAAPSNIASRFEDLKARLATHTQYTLDIAPGQFVPPKPDQWFFESMLDIFMKTPADPVFPAVLKAMAEHGYAMSHEAGNALRDSWGEEAVQGVLASNTEGKVLRDMRPVKMNGGSREGSVVQKLGTKKWPQKSAERAANPAAKPSRRVRRLMLEARNASRASGSLNNVQRHHSTNTGNYGNVSMGLGGVTKSFGDNIVAHM